MMPTQRENEIKNEIEHVMKLSEHDLGRTPEMHLHDPIVIFTAHLGSQKIPLVKSALKPFKPVALWLHFLSKAGLDATLCRSLERTQTKVNSSKRLISCQHTGRVMTMLHAGQWTFLHKLLCGAEPPSNSCKCRRCQQPVIACSNS